MINPFEYLNNPQADVDLASKLVESFNEPVSKTFFGDVDRTISSLNLAKAETGFDRPDLVAARKIFLPSCGKKPIAFYHMLCLKDIKVENFTRKTNQFLCGMNGSRLGYVVRASAKISCSRCQKIRKQYALVVSNDPMLDRVTYN